MLQSCIYAFFFVPLCVFYVLNIFTMKIISFIKIDGIVKMVMKGDSSLLVNRKPFFIPDWSNDIRMTPCIVLRISRLGKNIGAKFADRYYDSLALGVNIFAADYVSNGDWVRGFAFDYSLIVGEFSLIEHFEKGLVIPLADAIAEASSVMTLRQGDMIVIDQNVEPRPLQAEEVLREEKNGKEVLYCKIK